MYRIQTLIVLLECSLLALAWLPADKSLFSWQYDPAASAEEGGRLRSYIGRGKVAGKARRELANQKIRGVNLGSLFVMEPWMASSEWSKMGCASFRAEHECVVGIGQEAANKAFSRHWSSWITENDLKTMNQYGLNTIRVPVGFWLKEDLVGANEQYPQGGLAYLERLCGWAAAMQMYVILDLHGLPGAQKASAPFTGTFAEKALFYQNSEYGRAYEFLSWVTQLIHSNENFRTVGMLEAANEPIPGQSSLVNTYYPGAVKAVRDAEARMGIQRGNMLTIQFMDKRWGAGDPASSLNGRDNNLAFDNHHYLFAKTDITQSRQGYVYTTCSQANVSDNTPLIFGEWSLAVSNGSSDEFNPNGNNAKSWYQQWWAAQVTSYERHLGWIFWSWKTDLSDFRWDYQKAVKAGVIPSNPVQAYQISPC